MFDPISTYRIQFHSDFTFNHFEDIIPYLHKLGIKTIYASPIFKAVPGSMHGYDGLNPNEINPEIGTIEELRRISEHLKSLDMSWLQDIVPNHMAFHPDNFWLMDVLKHGEASPYRKYFDITAKDLSKDPLMVPFLGDDLEAVIARDELELIQEKEAWFLKYYDSIWPLRPETDVNAPVKTIAAQQFYRLCNYKESNEHINYRRFFTVNSLICLNMQYQETFDTCHQLTVQLVKEGVFQGIRIDHVDGLFDPTAYLDRLRAICGDETYIVVEKILEPGESLPLEWPVQGTTGYDYLGLLNQLFTNQKAEKKFDNFYKGINKYNRPVEEEIRRKKRAFLLNYMQGELENLFQLLLTSGCIDPQEHEPHDLEIFKALVAELLVRCPVYRLYGHKHPLPENEITLLNGIFKELEYRTEYRRYLNPLREALLNGDIFFYQRLMQFSGPLMAKGVEDTLMYTFNRFIGNNEVGDSPEVFGISVDDFHEAIAERYEAWPQTLNATATHDTKRGEDARARLNVLTDLRKEWIDTVRHWQELNLELKVNGSPDANDEYFIYQTLVATFPEKKEDLESYQSRLLEYIEKALRESKRNSEWETPDLLYEEQTGQFIKHLLDEKRKFWRDFTSFQQKVVLLGRISSLSALIIKFGSPGVPDTYQGTELWDLSMVDPDNRRPVDYRIRQQFLTDFDRQPADLKLLCKEAADGRIKLYFLHRLLKFRTENPLLFAEGLYVPLTVKGRQAAHVMAFARRYQQDWAVFLLPVNLAAVLDANADHVGKVDWEDTTVLLPADAPAAYRDVFRNVTGNAEGAIRLQAVFSDIPVAVLHFKHQERKRGAGILMHISSLPSAFGIGDFGPSAWKFLTFLAEAGQKYWQILPMNPLAGEQAYSPYSASSVMAGNTLLISPEELTKAGLLTTADLNRHAHKNRKKVSYRGVEKEKGLLLARAFERYRQKVASSKIPDNAFIGFCQKEAYWLDDYALYEVIKSRYKGKAWFDWPEGLRQRAADAVQAFSDKNHMRLEQIKWEQYIFFGQWTKLKQRAKALGIKIIGDLPFYTALDAADVWANPELFLIGRNGKLKGMAGVPPDYFNAEGQLWGMPVYNWKTMAKEKYKWWVQRIAKNMELYDLLRLDHFRAFSAYWEVPANSTSAKPGKWKPGPGIALFKTLSAQLGELPLIAEDFGDISGDVISLIEQLDLPGMKVLQFAFGPDLPDSIHLPHNYPNAHCLVYTGTHDNNTTLGWFEQELDEEGKMRIEKYLGIKISWKNINKAMIRTAYASIANIAIVPMQDILEKGPKARMNVPALVKNNWKWRLNPNELNETSSAFLKDLVLLYGR